MVARTRLTPLRRDWATGGRYMEHPPQAAPHERWRIDGLLARLRPSRELIGGGAQAARPVNRPEPNPVTGLAAT